MPKVISDAAVFDAVIRVLTTHGYAGATTRRIADEADVNEATLFRKYGSKPELVTAAIRRRAFAIDDDAVAYTGDMEADFLQAATLYADLLHKNGHLFATIMFEMARDPQLRQASVGPRSTMRDVAALCSRYVEEGRLHTDEDPFQMVASFLGPIILISMLQSASPRRAPAPLELQSHVRRFIAGRRPQTP